MLSRPVKVLTGPTLLTTPHRSTVIPSSGFAVCHFYLGGNKGKFARNYEAKSNNKSRKKLIFRIRDAFPGSWFVLIPVLWSRNHQQQQRRGGGGICSLTFLESQMSQNLKLLVFEQVSVHKKIWDNWQRIIVLLFLPKNCHWAIRNRGCGSRILKKLYRIPGSKSTRSRIWIRNTSKKKVLPWGSVADGNDLMLLPIPWILFFQAIQIRILPS